jgi:hypothetical protein
MPEETIPVVREELGVAVPERKLPTTITSQTTTSPNAAAQEEGPPDPLEDERRRIMNMQNELDQYINDLLKNRLEQTIKFGKTFSANYVAEYLQQMFGDMLYFDSFLSIIQQYGLCDVEIVNPQGKTGLRTGWSYALFGEPGTGKSFSTRDLVLGSSGGKMEPHGVPGRNRYCGGITPARFIRIARFMWTKPSTSLFQNLMIGSATAAWWMCLKLPWNAEKSNMNCTEKSLVPTDSAVSSW